MTKSESSKIWIEAGYQLFAQEGPDGVQIEKLSRIVNRNKSGFYHHFGDRDLFFYELLEHHYHIIDQYTLEVSLSKFFKPDVLVLLCKYRAATLLQMQLRRHMHIPMFGEAFTRVRKITEQEIVPLWAAYLKIYNNTDLARDLWFIMRDVFFMRVTWDNLTPDFLYRIVDEFVAVIGMVRHTALLTDTSSLTRIRQAVLRK